MPQISVIVPVYKVEKYIHRCVDSILAQTFSDFELILVDDGSPDNCGLICDEYAAKDTRVVVIHQNNGGLSAARNAGIDWVFAHSDSEWITFVDSDDYIDLHYLESFVHLVNNEPVDIAVCKSRWCDQLETIQDEPIWYTDFFTITGKEACESIYQADGKIAIEVWGKLYRRPLLEGIRFPVGKQHEDQAIVPIVLYKASALACSRYTGYRYYIRNDSIMHKSFEIKRFDDIEAIEGCIDFFSLHEEADIVKLASKRRMYLLAMYNFYSYQEGIHEDIPLKYKFSRLKALVMLKKASRKGTFAYNLSKISNMWAKVYSVWSNLQRRLSSKV